MDRQIYRNMLTSIMSAYILILGIAALSVLNKWITWPDWLLLDLVLTLLSIGLTTLVFLRYRKHLRRCFSDRELFGTERTEIVLDGNEPPTAQPTQAQHKPERIHKKIRRPGTPEAISDEDLYQQLLRIKQEMQPIEPLFEDAPIEMPDMLDAPVTGTTTTNDRMMA